MNDLVTLYLRQPLMFIIIFNFTHSVRFVVTSHCGFKLSPVANDVEHLPMLFNPLWYVALNFQNFSNFLQ